jgi:nucleoid-associated protein YgaU
LNEPEHGFPGTDSNEETSARESADDHDEAEHQPRGNRIAQLMFKKETRVGLAALLSFVILITVLIVNHARRKPTSDATAQKDKHSSDKPVVKGERSPSESPRAISTGSLAARAPKPDKRLAMRIGGTGERPAPSPLPASAPPDEANDKQEAPAPVTDRPATTDAPPDRILIPEPVHTTAHEKTSTTTGEVPNPASGSSIVEGTAVAQRQGEAGSNGSIAAPPEPVLPENAQPATDSSADRTTRAPAVAELPSTLAPAPATQPPAASAKPVEASAKSESTPTSPPRSALPTFEPSPASEQAPVSPRSAASDSGLIPLPNALPRTVPEVSSDSQPRPSLPTSETAGASRSGSTELIEPVRHVVQRGENFWTIARLYYGSGRFYKALWAANSGQVTAPDQLFVGTTILVPPPEALDRKLIELPRGSRGDSASTPSPTSASRRRTTSQGNRGASQDNGEVVMLPIGRPSADPAEVSPSLPEKPVRYHIVQPYETLRSIARDTLGDSRRADEIRSRNLRTLNGSDVLTPGLRLELPDDARVIRR